MKLSWRTGIALAIGGIMLGGSLSAVAQDDETPVGGERVKMMHGGPGAHGGPMGKGLVRSEALVEGEEDGTFNTLRHDRGIVTAIDGNTITFDEADGRSVEVTVDEDTRIGRDHEEAEIGDIEVGDHVGVHRVREGDDGDFVTKHVMAISAERYEEMEAAREACTDDDQATECERPMHRRRGPGGPFRDGAAA